MPITQDFDYARPQQLAEALQILSEYKANGRVLAGGTDLANMMKMGFKVPQMMVDIKQIKELQGIREEKDGVVFGANLTFTEIIESKLVKEKLYIIWEAANLVASPGVRNRATMVGNICSAVPCLDSATPLLVLEANVLVQNAAGKRSIPIHQWFVDARKTALAEDEMVTGIFIPIPKQKNGGCYQKMMRYSGEDLSQANVGLLALEDKTFRVAFGSVGPIPKRSPKIEHLLNTKGDADAVIEEAKAMIETVIAPITDVRATKEYRMHMTKVMFERALKAALERMK